MVAKASPWPLSRRRLSADQPELWLCDTDSPTRSCPGSRAAPESTSRNPGRRAYLSEAHQNDTGRLITRLHGQFFQAPGLFILRPTLRADGILSLRQPLHLQGNCSHSVPRNPTHRRPPVSVGRAPKEDPRVAVIDPITRAMFASLPGGAARREAQQAPTTATRLRPAGAHSRCR